MTNNFEVLSLWGGGGRKQQAPTAGSAAWAASGAMLDRLVAGTRTDDSRRKGKGS